MSLQEERKAVVAIINITGQPEDPDHFASCLITHTLRLQRDHLPSLFRRKHCLTAGRSLGALILLGGLPWTSDRHTRSVYQNGPP